MERKLVSIRKVSKVEKHPNADALEICSVDGWKVVSKIGDFQEGDFVIYFEIDSFLPITETFEFLRKTSYKKMSDGTEGFRLKTIRLRGQLSQGLILPIDIIPFPHQLDYYEVGLDVTDFFNVRKYEPPIPAELSGKVKGAFPSFIPKTDEERVQNFVSEYSALSKEGKANFYITEKLDGSSATYYYNDGVFGVCSRNLDLLETEGNTFWKVAREMDIENKLKLFGFNVAVQGELIGEGIQGNPYKIKGQTVKIFNCFNIDKQEHLDYKSFVTIVDDIVGFDLVPILDDKFVLPLNVEDLISMADDKSKLNPNTDREGIVVRSLDRKISFKVISNKFLLNEK